MTISDSQAKELLDRTRRIETRFTRYLEDRGFDTMTDKPYFDADACVLHIPTPKVSLQACLAAMPEGYNMAHLQLPDGSIGILSRLVKGT